MTSQPLDIPAHLLFGFHGDTLLTFCKDVNLTELKSQADALRARMRGMAKIDPQKVGRRLAALRKTEDGMTQAALAARLGVSNGAVALWETGDRELKYHYLEKLCAIFRITPDVLLIGDLEGVTGRRRAALQEILDDTDSEE